MTQHSVIPFIDVPNLPKRRSLHTALLYGGSLFVIRIFYAITSP
jgi:hypothetical protein